MTFFGLNNHAEEWAAILAGETVVVDLEGGVAEVTEATVQNTRDFVRKAIVTNLKGHPTSQLVADLLRTMGYRTTVSPPGTDGGIDILAHRDELGFEPPIVRVQVKSSEGSVSGPDMAQLVGNLGRGDHGLFVTMGTFSTQAKEKAAKSEIRLINGETFLDLILDHYEELSPRYKAVFPLKRVYVPQTLGDE
jgi:restriction system protein